MATVEFTGNLASDPELRSSKNGEPWATALVIENYSKRQDDGSYKELRGEPRDIVVFGRMAENFAKSCKKGTTVRVEATDEPNDFINKDGEIVEKMRYVVRDITISLRYATAVVTRNTKGDTAVEETPSAA